MARTNAAEILAKAAETFKQRNAVYKDNYYTHGRVMEALYPGGVFLRDSTDFTRFGVINMIVSKLGRYATDPQAPHLDSIHDLVVYAAILEAIDTNEAES